MYMKTKFVCKRDNLDIVGFEYRFEGDHLPIVIISHGFMANLNMCKSYAHFFEMKGYCAFIFDFNGGGLLSRSEGKSEDMSIYSEEEDLKAVIEYAKSLEYTDETNITLVGCSQGGVVSGLVASELKEAISNLILLYPAFCIHDDACKGKMLLMKFDPNNLPETINCGLMKIGKGYIEAALRFNPWTEACAYKGPTLIIHGTEDKIVDYEYANKAAAFYANCKVVILGGAGHAFGGLHKLKAMKEIEDFLKL